MAQQELHTNTKNIPVIIVFFAYMMKNWDVFIEIANNLRNSPSYDIADFIYIAATIRDSDLDKFKSLLQSLLPKAQIYINDEENDFEYKGLRCLYETATESSISLYVHTKGAFYDTVGQILIRRVMNAVLFQKAQECISFIQQGYSKVCAYKNKEGICWYNLFWASGKLIRSKGKPLHEKSNRYYYETYLNCPYKKIKALRIGSCIKGDIVGGYDLVSFEHGTPSPLFIPHTPLQYLIKYQIKVIKNTLKSILKYTK